MRPKFTVFGFFAATSLVCVAITSCSDDMGGGGVEPLTTEPVAAQPTTGEEAAVATFNEFMDIFLQAQAEQGETRSVASRPKVSGVRSTNTVAYGEPFSATRSSEDGVPVYELTLQSDDSTEGFAVVAGEDDLQSVLAYVPQGSIADTTFNAGLAMWFREMYAMGRDTQSDPETRANEWDDDWMEPDVWDPDWTLTGYWRPATGSRYRSEYVRDMTAAEKADGINDYWWGPIVYEPQNKVGPFLHTEWGQKMPYNYFMPDWKRDANGVMLKYYAGCAPLAIAQIIAYHQHSANMPYSWHLFATKPTVALGTTEAIQVAGLIRNIGDALRAEYNDYTGYRNANNLYQYTPTFDLYGYSATMNSQLNSNNNNTTMFPVIESDLSEEKPVLIVGFASAIGHAWVIDGYYYLWRWLYHEKSTGTIPSRYEIWRTADEIVLLHYNWGTHGQSNGWYYSYTPAHRPKTYEHSYYQDKTIWTGISPK